MFEKMLYIRSQVNRTFNIMNVRLTCINQSIMTCVSVFTLTANLFYYRNLTADVGFKKKKSLHNKYNIFFLKLQY